MRSALACALLLAVVALPVAPAPAQDEPSYRVRYEARLVPSQRAAEVAVRLSRLHGHVHSVRFRVDPKRYTGFRADGRLDTTEGFVTWRPPEGGGTLRYVFRIDRKRTSRSYDARCAEDWALFRGDDLVPPVRVVATRGASSEAELELRLPAGWSAVTPFPKVARGRWRVDQPHRRFDRPTGWILAARKLGVLREKVAGVRLAIAAPAGAGARRLDALALLRLGLPALRQVVDPLPERLLVVLVGDPMYRGGLSAPASLFLHTDRPLITPDVTSPLLHEVSHVVLGSGGSAQDDWLVEGIAELYSVELLARSRLISHRRYRKALEGLGARGRGVALGPGESTGRETARAVAMLHALDQEIRRDSGGRHSLDDVYRRLAQERGPQTAERLKTLADEAAGQDLTPFFRRQGVRLRSAR